MAGERRADELVAEGLRIVAGARTLVEDATLRVGAGEIVALVGSSGSGKTVTARALLGMVPFAPGRVAGRVTLTVDGHTSTPETEADFRPLRGRAIGLLWQDARAALDPLRTIGTQVLDAARLAGPVPSRDALLLAPDGPLARAGFADPARVARLHPHELSGGMAQRAAIAVALARNSRFLVADEPTTGLDPSVQRGILAQLSHLAAAGMGLLFITHDLRLLPGFATRVVVMDHGRTVEEAATTAGLAGAGRALVEATRKVAGGVL
ncbi:MAG: ATP-binding cassette domain-containing protein [Pseudomonadota bacterium]|nr:ATP-binding cassette domain-containing protein [Pseudomonadota bacterium]